MLVGPRRSLAGVDLVRFGTVRWPYRGVTAVLITLNGERFELERPMTVLDLLARLDIDPRRVAIEHNLEIIRRRTFESVVVQDGDRVEIVNAVGRRLSSHGHSVRHRGPHLPLAAHRRHRQVPVPRRHAAGARGVGRRHGHRGRPAREHLGSVARVAPGLHRRGPHLPAAEHRRVLHRGRGHSHGASWGARRAWATG